MDILKFSETPYIDNHQLKPILKDYQNPDDFISRLVKSGQLIRLKQGFYLIEKKIESEPIPYEQIANLLYGPSYVSYEWALSYYGLIPEGVYLVTSATLKRSRTFKSPVGVFDYYYQNPERYSIGITQMKNGTGNFMIASPEKALVDLVHQKSKSLSVSDLITDLLEARRLDEKALKNFNKDLLKEIASRYHSKVILNLVKAYEKLQS